MGNLAKLEPSVEETSRLYLPVSQVPFARPKITDGLQLRGLARRVHDFKGCVSNSL
jgi:hypothetical protein